MNDQDDRNPDLRRLAQSTPEPWSPTVREPRWGRSDVDDHPTSAGEVPTVTSASVSRWDQRPPADPLTSSGPGGYSGYGGGQSGYTDRYASPERYSSGGSTASSFGSEAYSSPDRSSTLGGWSDPSTSSPPSRSAGSGSPWDTGPGTADPYRSDPTMRGGSPEHGWDPGAGNGPSEQSEATQFFGAVHHGHQQAAGTRPPQEDRPDWPTKGAMALHVAAPVLMIIALSAPQGGNPSWDRAMAWSLMAVVASVTQAAPILRGTREKLERRWRTAKVSLAALGIFWVLLTLPIVTSNVGFLQTLAVATAGSALWLDRGARYREALRADTQPPA